MMQWIDLHIVFMGMICGVVQLGLRSLIPASWGAAIIILILEVMLFMRVVDEKRWADRIYYAIVNELVVAVIVVFYLFVCH